MATETQRDWRALCKAVSVEMDSTRLRALLTELMQVMEIQPNDRTGENSVAITNLAPAVR